MITRIIAGFVAAVAIFITIAMSINQNAAVGLGWLAWGMPIAFIGFVNLIFEVGWGLFIKAHKGAVYSRTHLKKDLVKEGMRIVRLRYLGGVLCIVSALLLETVNVVTIIGAQVNAMQSLLKISVVAASTDIADNASDLVKDKIDLEASKKELMDTWKQRKAELNKVLVALYPNVADRVTSPEYASYNSELAKYDTKLTDFNARIDKKQAEIEKARSDKLSAKTTESASKEGYVGSVYTFIGKIFKADSTYVQFWMVALPSLFLGIISCVSLSLAIYGKSNKKEEK